MSGLSSPAGFGEPITPSDTVNLLSPTRGIYVASSGGTIIAVLAGKGDVVTLTNVPNGILPIAVRRINNSGTTATGIVGLW